MTYPDPFVDHPADCPAPCCCLGTDCDHPDCEPIPGYDPSDDHISDAEFDALIAKVVA